MSDIQKQTLDSAISYDELSIAVSKLNNNKSPGLDGLPNEFYKTFWPVIGNDMHEVFASSIEDNRLPLSCRRAVLTMIPKKGDTSYLKNWRPVSLLCCDYKILTRALSLRLRTVLPDILHINQSYCVPGRHISDNIRFISDATCYANEEHLPLAIVSLDQEKAFDRIHHDYLFKTLESFGFGDYLLSCIRTLYTNVQSLLKINNSLTSPFQFQRGIRQGCSLSGQLYAICLEPLLHKLRSDEGLSGLKLPLSGGKKACLSAYADDLNTLLTSDRDFDRLSFWLDIYQKSSNSKVNLQKTEGLWVGKWKNRSDCPMDLKWNNKGLKVLGTFVGNTKDFYKQNWEGMEDEISIKLDKWKPFARGLSLRGRTLVINLLSASKLWHRLNSVAVPDVIINAIQNKFVDFLWQGKHWVSKEMLYLPVNTGGQGLVHIISRIRDFRIQFVYRFLTMMNDEDVHPCFYFCKYFLSNVSNLNYDVQLFLLDGEFQYRNIPTFYQDIVKTWKCFESSRILNDELSIADVLEEPLFFNPLLVNPKTDEPFYFENFVTAGITKVKDIIDLNNRCKLTALDLVAKLSTKSVRCIQQHLDLLWASFSPEWNALLSKFLNCSTDVGVVHQYVFKLDLENTSESSLGVILDRSPKKLIYLLSVVLNFNNSRTKKSLSPWISILGTAVPPNIIYSHVYDKPHNMHEGDLNWRFLHGALSTSRFYHQAGYDQVDTCPTCGEQETLFHMFMACPRLQSLAGLVSDLLGRLIGGQEQGISFVFGPTAVGHSDALSSPIRAQQSSPVGPSSSRTSCPARGLFPADQPPSLIGCPVQDGGATPADPTTSRVSCPVRRPAPADPTLSRVSCPVQNQAPSDPTPPRVSCPDQTSTTADTDIMPMVMDDGTVVLGECTKTHRWTKMTRLPRRLSLWIATQAKMAIYVTAQHIRSGGGETDPLKEFKSRIRARLQIEFAYYRFVNNIVSFSDFWCYNNILCSISDDKLIVNI